METHQFNDFQYSGNRLEIGNVECNPAQWSGTGLIWWGWLWWCIVSTWIDGDYCFGHHIILRGNNCVATNDFKSFGLLLETEKIHRKYSTRLCVLQNNETKKNCSKFLILSWICTPKFNVISTQKRVRLQPNADDLFIDNFVRCGKSATTTRSHSRAHSHSRDNCVPKNIKNNYRIGEVGATNVCSKTEKFGWKRFLLNKNSNDAYLTTGNLLLS